MALRIKEILKEQGKQNKWLAEQLEITEPGLWLIMTEKVNVPLRRLEQIANILGVSVVELFTEFEEAVDKRSNTIKCPHCGNDIKVVVSIK